MTSSAFNKFIYYFTQWITWTSSTVFHLNKCPMLPARKTVAKEQAFPQRKEIKKIDYKIMIGKHDQKHASRHGYTYILHVYVHMTYICIWAKANTKYVHIYTYILRRIYAYACPSKYLLISICQIFAFFFYIHTMYKTALWIKNPLQKQTYQTMYKSCSKCNWNSTSPLV